MRFVLLLSLAVVVAGVALALTVGSLLAYLLVIGGVGALGVVVLPQLVELFTTFLSTGSVRRRY